MGWEIRRYHLNLPSIKSHTVQFNILHLILHFYSPQLIKAAGNAFVWFANTYHKQQILFIARKSFNS